MKNGYFRGGAGWVFFQSCWDTDTDNLIPKASFSALQILQRSTQPSEKSTDSLGLNVPFSVATSN